MALYTKTVVPVHPDGSNAAQSGWDRQHVFDAVETMFSNESWHDTTVQTELYALESDNTNASVGSGPGGTSAVYRYVSDEVTLTKSGATDIKCRVRRYYIGSFEGIVFDKIDTKNNALTGWVDGDTVTILGADQSYPWAVPYNPASNTQMTEFVTPAQVSATAKQGWAIQCPNGTDGSPWVGTTGTHDVIVTIRLRTFGRGGTKFWMRGRDPSHSLYDATFNGDDMHEYMAVLQVVNDATKHYGKSQYLFYFPNPTTSSTDYGRLGSGINFGPSTWTQGTWNGTTNLGANPLWYSWGGRGGIDHQEWYDSNDVTNYYTNMTPFRYQCYPEKNNPTQIPLELVYYKTTSDTNQLFWCFRQISSGIVKTSATLSLIRGKAYTDGSDGEIWGKNSNHTLDMNNQYLAGVQYWQGTYNHEDIITGVSIGGNYYGAMDHTDYNKKYYNVTSTCPEGNYLSAWLYHLGGGGGYDHTTRSYADANQYNEYGNSMAVSGTYHNITLLPMANSTATWQGKQTFLNGPVIDPEQSMLFDTAPAIKTSVTKMPLFPKMEDNPYYGPDGLVFIPIDGGISSARARQGDTVVITAGVEEYEILQAGTMVNTYPNYGQKANGARTDVAKIFAMCVRTV